MTENQSTDSGNKLLKRVLALIVSFGPGIFAIGYTIGTGSVTSMIVAGSEFGMQLLWVLMLSCLFSALLIFVSDFTLPCRHGTRGGCGRHDSLDS